MGLMTVAELIIELKKLEDQSTEVWVDTSAGLFPVTCLYQDSDTAIIIHSHDSEPTIYN